MMSARDPNTTLPAWAERWVEDLEARASKQGDRIEELEAALANAKAEAALLRGALKELRGEVLRYRGLRAGQPTLVQNEEG